MSLLLDIRNAVKNYVDAFVRIQSITVTPTSGATINPSEEFTVVVKGKNTGDTAVKNVRWDISVASSSVAKLIVPAAPMVARSGVLPSSTLLTAGSQVSAMHLFPASDVAGNYMSPSDEDTVTIKGKAGAAVGGGNTTINAALYAEIDMDFVFPKNEDGPNFAKTLSVIG